MVAWPAATDLVPVCMNKEFLDLAIKLSEDNLTTNEGGPFGAVIIRDNQIIGKGKNRVTSKNDPTAHAEIEAIRDACKNTNSFSLKGCEIYSSCEPCPMCLAAIYWARIDAVYYANTKFDAAEIGFDDSYIYDQLTKEPDLRDIKMLHIKSDDAKSVFQKWQIKQDKTDY